MQVKNAQYYKNFQGEITSVLCEIDGVKFVVAIDPNNRHYAEIMRQVEAGELTIQEADN